MAIDTPYGVTLKPRRAKPSEEAELDIELAELEEIRAKALQNKELHRDPIGEMIDAKHCLLNHRFWFLQYRGMPLTVSRYYQDKNVAVDVFETIGPEEAREVAFKRAAFAMEHVRYAALDYSMDAGALLPQIAKIKLWPFSRK